MLPTALCGFAAEMPHPQQRWNIYISAQATCFRSDVGWGRVLQVHLPLLRRSHRFHSTRMSPSHYLAPPPFQRRSHKHNSIHALLSHVWHLAMLAGPRLACPQLCGVCVQARCTSFCVLF